MCIDSAVSKLAMTIRGQTQPDSNNKNFCALIVGIGRRLPQTRDDALGIGRILIDPLRCALPIQQVAILTERDASRENLLSALDQLAHSATPDQTIIIYFAGHGGIVKLSATYYLTTFGYSSENPASTAISGREFADKLTAIKAGHLLLLMDCCHAYDIVTEPILGQSWPDFYPWPIPPEVAQLTEQNNNLIVMSSCKPEQFSFIDTPYSLFARAIIECLSGQNLNRQSGNGTVWALDLVRYTQEKINQWTTGRQQPIALIGHGEDFALAHYDLNVNVPLPIMDLPPLDVEKVDRTNRQRILPKRPYSSSTGMSFDIKSGGAHVGGNVEAGNDFVGRDQINVVIGDIARFRQLFQGMIASQDQQVNLANPLSVSHEPIRLDVAHPKSVIVDQTFRIVTAIKQPLSLPLNIEMDEPSIIVSDEGTIERYGDLEVRYRVEVSSLDCEIITNYYIFCLEKGKDSKPFSFLLKAHTPGKIPILVHAYQLNSRHDKEVVANTMISITAEIESRLAQPVP